MKDFYTIEDVTLMTGLSDRTIRTYLAQGFLQGDKSTGAWHITGEQLDDFFANPAVLPSIRAKQNAVVYDFLAAKPAAGRRMCVVLDLGPEEDGAAASEALCRAMCKAAPEAELRFAAGQRGRGTRIFLSGAEKDVRSLLQTCGEK